MDRCWLEERPTLKHAICRKFEDVGGRQSTERAISNAGCFFAEAFRQYLRSVQQQPDGEAELCSSVRLARDAVSATTSQKVQVRADIRLHHALHIELLIAAFHGVRRRLPQTTATLQLSLWNVEVKASCLYI